MAGSYPDSPGRRMAWDLDGSIVTVREASGGGTATEGTSGNRSTMNNESEGDWQFGAPSSPSRYLNVMFPEPREMFGTFYAYESDGHPGAVDTSTDTTNTADGNWSNQIANISNIKTTAIFYRDSITSLATSTVVGIRVFIQNVAANRQQRVKAWHFYGEISPGETPDRILILDTENGDAEFTKVLDFGDVPRGQTTTRTFKIKNNSASLSINTILVTAEDLTLNAGDWYEFGDDGVSYQATHAVGNMSNGAEETIYLKQVIPPAETLGLQAGRIKVSHDSLS